MDNQTPIGSATASLANAEPNTVYTINDSTLLQGFSDPDNDTLRVSGLLADSGEITKSSSGQWQFTPDTGFTGTVTLDYGVVDGYGGQIAGTLSFLVMSSVQTLPSGSVVISGIAQQYQTLTVSNTLADVNILGPISYQWLSNGVSLLNANQATYTLTQTDVGKSISVTASYTDGLHALEQVTSQATAAIANVNDLPTGEVTISGLATQGMVLSASNTLADADGLGTISYQWLANGVAISGATTDTLTLTQANVGKTISVTASYTDATGVLESKTSLATSAVANTNDLPTGSVSISGAAIQNQTLTATNTLLDADGLGIITYQWLANGVAISGATTDTLNLTQATVGKTISVTASYTDATGVLESKTSLATSTVANVNDLPTGSVSISGAAIQNQLLTASNTLADVDGLGTITYQWLANGVAITGATTDTLSLTQATVGKTISVTASYTDAMGSLESKTSVATAAVANINDLPTGSVVITGTAKQGELLSASHTLADVDGLGTIGYQWLANGVAISGATTDTLTLTQANVGKTISVTASYTDATGVLESKTSLASAVVTNTNDLPTGSVVITGTAKQGAVLTATNTLADADGLGTITYQWSANGVAISGATTDTLNLTQATVGKIISVTASYTDATGVAESKTSADTVAIANTNDLPTGSVRISGTATQNQVLMVSNNLADIDGLGEVTYQWLANGVAVEGATDDTFTLTQATVGKTISVTASYTDAMGSLESKNSPATAAVININDLPTGAVVITGTARQGELLSASHTLADVDGLGAITYQWLASGVAIDGANADTLTLTQATVGKRISVMGSYTDATGVLESKTSVTTTAVVNSNDLPAGAVAIAGTAKQGEVLTASNTLTDADGLGVITYQWLANGVAISGATADTLSLTQASVGKLISVTASYTDATGVLESKTSLATAAVTNINDLPTGAVAIAGTAKQGEVLTASNTLSDADGLGAITYQWLANGVAISGATAETLTLTQASIAKAISVTASYTDATGVLESKTSVATAAVANTNDLPAGSVAIAGTAKQGGVLTASNTLTDADGLGSITYQWLANGIVIDGATTNTLNLTQASVGKTISVTASYTDATGVIESKTSVATAAVANTNDLPTGSVVITGTAKQGAALTATNTLADADGLGAITYQWLANGVAIDSATTNTLNLTQASVGKAISVTASYTDATGVIESKASVATAAVANINDLPTGSVVISGAATQGVTLTASNTLSDADGLGGITYQWFANHIAVGTGTQYRLSQADVKKVITVTASYTDGFSALENVSSRATAAVKNINDQPSGSVSLSDTSPQLWQTITASNTLKDLDGVGAVAYTWISSATVVGKGAQYTPQISDIGNTLSVTARYTDGFGQPESVSSTSSAAVAPLTAAFIVDKGDTSTSESGDTATISVKLATAPTREVSVKFSSSDTSEGVLSNSSLTFNSSNWFTPQTVLVTGQNDYLNDGTQPVVISVAVDSTDVNYRQLRIAPIKLTNAEDVTTQIDDRIPVGTARDVPLKIYGDAIVDPLKIDKNTHLFDTTGSKPVNDVLHGLDGNDTIYGGNLQDDLSGGIGNDMLSGENDEDHLYGQDGNDTLYGGEGIDTLEGGVGNDVLNCSDGDLKADIMIGGAGDDTYYLGINAEDIITDKGLSTDVDTVIMPYQVTSYTLPNGIENGAITKGSSRSSLTGNNSNNALTGNDGVNLLSGEKGNDSLIGGLGNDTLSGGSGKDSFVFDAALKSNLDKVTDFNPADDQIVLDNQIFAQLTQAGNLNAAQFVTGATARDSDDFVIYNPINGALSYDADGSGAGQGVQIVQLGVNLAITSADFVVI
jgi:hypothetical protein